MKQHEELIEFLDGVLEDYHGVYMRDGESACIKHLSKVIFKVAKELTEENGDEYHGAWT